MSNFEKLYCRISILFYCSSCGEEISRVLSGVAKSGICKCRKCK